MYKLTRLDNFGSAFFYQAFTFPQVRHQLKALKPEGATVAISASDSAQPIGLALAEILPDSKSAEVHSVFVARTHRRKGIGTDLLSRLEEELFLRDCTSAELIYTTGQPTTLALERLLQKRNWTPPQPWTIVCKTTTDKIANAPWMQKSSLPASYTLFPWVEITSEERVAIEQQQEAEPWIPLHLIPFKHDENLEPLNSLGLRYQGQVVGWLITHRIAPDTIRYSCSFIRQDLQKMGRIVPLYVNAIQRQVKAKIPRGIWDVPLVHTSMVRFVKKYMGPYGTSLEESRRSCKSLIDA
ncbi:MAG: GNAT family N-acetyltransferase [Stigonema ocellatum SAG 48.90 = DSM 106950]|nr:GNAT family N-acetyltransferase [Stigonema ocellatum SAG 48.90 = DSM 106950]